MPTDTNQQYIELMNNPIIANATKKAQEDSKYISEITKDVKEDLDSALKKIGPEARNQFIAYFAGGDLYKRLISAIESKYQATDVLRTKYNDETWTNAVRKLDYSTAEEKTREYAAEIKSEEISRISKEKEEGKIKYLLNEIKNSPEKNEIYQQIATILKDIGYKPRSLEEIAAQPNNNKNKQQQKQPEDSRKQESRLAKTVSGNQNNNKDKKKKSLTNRLRYLTGLDEVPEDDDNTNYKAQLKELRNKYLKPRNQENNSHNPTLKPNKENSNQEKTRNIPNKNLNIQEPISQAARNVIRQAATKVEKEQKHPLTEKVKEMLNLNETPQRLKQRKERIQAQQESIRPAPTYSIREFMSEKNLKNMEERNKSREAAIIGKLQMIDRGAQYEILDRQDDHGYPRIKILEVNTGILPRPAIASDNIEEIKFEVEETDNKKSETPRVKKTKEEHEYYHSENLESSQSIISLATEILNSSKSNIYKSSNPEAGIILTEKNHTHYKSNGSNSKKLDKNFKYNLDDIVESKSNTPKSNKRKYILK